MKDFYIFDIPIYRCQEQKFYKDIETSVAKRHEELFARTGIPKEEAPKSYARAEEHTRQNYGGPWHFNQIIGWLKLYAAPSHVGGHLWWVDAKRIQRIIRGKRFYLTTDSDILATSFKPDDDSDKIYRETLVDIKRIAGERPLKGRYVDLENFCNLGPYINWRALLDNAGNPSEELKT